MMDKDKFVPEDDPYKDAEAQPSLAEKILSSDQQLDAEEGLGRKGYETGAFKAPENQEENIDSGYKWEEIRKQKAEERKKEEEAAQEPDYMQQRLLY